MTNTAGGRLKKGNQVEQQVPIGADASIGDAVLNGEMKQEVGSAAAGSGADVASQGVNEEPRQ